MASTKKKVGKTGECSGANADGGTIEQGQSDSVRDKAGSKPAGEADWLDETERDSPERQKIRSQTSPTPGKKR